eukprot:CAMPEP_0174332270 /NCGR_PEP_ID=MMETSP0810-20121108/18168_1 /TAXON_ID=73025 ORGANISM="Eutreptiella gymnastica-like, Strain CCMP1594" /NCGR_SAMPLE_ID=MMETSP0810 /ASSEMBLY_ACC=CAM_ASM_000659 /LENGTH=108 /DNA_ID=CAMNT_0015448587 /DNA_START=832 /DNA_END=1158 /DNA_ORIENTATION=-
MSKCFVGLPAHFPASLYAVLEALPPTVLHEPRRRGLLALLRRWTRAWIGLQLQGLGCAAAYRTGLPISGITYRRLVLPKLQRHWAILGLFGGIPREISPGYRHHWVAA